MLSIYRLAPLSPDHVVTSDNQRLAQGGDGIDDNPPRCDAHGGEEVQYSGPCCEEIGARCPLRLTHSGYEQDAMCSLAQLGRGNRHELFNANIGARL